MKIGIDISQLAYEGTGVARYTNNLVYSLCSADSKNEYVFFFSSLRRSIPDELKTLIQKKHRLVEMKLPLTILEFLWNQLHKVPIEKFIGNIDIFISSDWTQPPSNAKKVTVVHDLIAYKYPNELHPKTEFTVSSLNLSSNIVAVQKRRLEWVKKEVDLIIADSQSTKKDLIDLLGIGQNCIKVVYPSVSILPQSPNSLITLPTSKPFILSVGKLEPRKNINRLISAFQKANLKDLELIIVGPDGWKASDYPRVAGGTPQGWPDQENVRFLGFVPDDDLYTLYKQAEFFIYPSLYEGFGYPVVEAMALGCAVATANTSSLKEIAEGNALLFDPNSEEAITQVMIKLHSDQKLRQELSNKGMRRAKDFSSEKFASAFLMAISAVK